MDHPFRDAGIDVENEGWTDFKSGLKMLPVHKISMCYSRSVSLDRKLTTTQVWILLLIASGIKSYFAFLKIS